MNDDLPYQLEEDPQPYSYSRIVTPDQWGVHIGHCCVYHGCKYGDDEQCPVESKKAVQKYPCESCGEIKEEQENFFTSDKGHSLYLELVRLAIAGSGDWQDERDRHANANEWWDKMLDATYGKYFKP